MAGGTVARGYGQTHRAERKRWARDVERGVVCCARCGRPIIPGTPWVFGHDDHDRTIHTGPEHVRCNRRTSAHRAARRRRRSVYDDRDVVVVVTAERVTSREW